MAYAHEPLTAESLASMPDDGRRYEIIDGVLIVNPAPIPLAPACRRALVCDAGALGATGPRVVRGTD